MNLEAAWGLLRTHRLDAEHMEAHESGHGMRWEEERHTGYVIRPCSVCGDPFIVSPGSDATDCGGAHLQRSR